eukprot:339869-Alexandrium_andersonii.AAC.1
MGGASLVQLRAHGRPRPSARASYATTSAATMLRSQWIDSERLRVIGSLVGRTVLDPPGTPS